MIFVYVNDYVKSPSTLRSNMYIMTAFNLEIRLIVFGEATEIKLSLDYIVILVE
jgi:hypothetical protein